METKSLKEIYNEICIQIAEDWKNNQKASVPVSYFANIIGTSIPAMKGILKRCPQLVEVLPDYYTVKEIQYA